MRPFVNSPKMEHQSWARNSRRSRCSVCWRSSRCNRSDLRGTVASQRSQQLTRAAPPVPCALRPALWFRRLVGWRRFTRPRRIPRPPRAGVICKTCMCSSSFARIGSSARQLSPVSLLTRLALTGSVSFNYSVPLPLYMYNVLSTRSRSLAARPAVGLQHSPLSVCRTPPACSAAKIHARWRRRTVIVVSAAPSRLRRIPSTGTSSWARSEPFKSQCPWGLSSP